MIRKLVCAMGVMVIAFGIAAAEEFNAYITKVDGNKITVQKYKKKDKDGDPVTLEVAKDATIAAAKVSGKGKETKYEAGDKIEGGLKSDVLSKGGDKGVLAHITTDADNKKVTSILVLQKKKAAQ